MFFGKIACAFGKHTVDRSAIKHNFASDVGRCRHCGTMMEQHEDHWTVHRVHDAGLGHQTII